MEKSDEFDEWMLNRQIFPIKILRLKVFGNALEFVTVSIAMLGLVILK